MDTQTIQELTAVEKQKVVKSDIPERRRRYLVRWQSIKAERGRQWPVWQALTDYIMPERGRFLSSDHNKPKDTSKILNNVPTRMARSLSAGLMSGITSPARPWFNMTVPDPQLAEWGPVREWLYLYNQRVRQVLDLSGFYRAMAMGIYPDVSTYGLGAMLAEADPQRVVRFVPLAMGSYGLAQNGRGLIDCIMYEEPWTVGELIKEFGWENCSPSVKTAWNGGYLEQYVNVLRVIAPNEEFLPGGFGRKGMKYGAVYMEIGGLNSSSGALAQPSTDPAIGFLREEGYADFPALIARWSTTARDVYPTGPGHDALNDARQLMQMERRSLLALSKGINPPMLIPEQMRMQRLSMLPGDPVYVPSGMNGQKIEPAQVVDVRWMAESRADKQQCMQRIGQAFFAELMLMFTDNDPGAGKQPVTAQEIAAKQQEKMLQLGPVLENFNEFLSLMVDPVVGLMERRGLIPPAPKQIQGMKLKVEFISVLAQAQKLINTGAKERALAFAGQAAQLMAAHGQEGPAQVADKFNMDKMLDRYMDDLGVPPDTLNDDEVVQKMREARAQQAQQAQEQQQALSAADAAKNLGQANLGGDNGGTLLGKLVGPLGAANAGGGA